MNVTPAAINYLGIYSYAGILSHSHWHRCKHSCYLCCVGRAARSVVKKKSTECACIGRRSQILTGPKQ